MFNICKLLGFLLICLSPLVAEVRLRFPAEVEFSCASDAVLEPLRKLKGSSYTLSLPEDSLNCFGSNLSGDSFRLNLTGLRDALLQVVKKRRPSGLTTELSITQLTVRYQDPQSVQGQGGFKAKGVLKRVDEFQNIKSEAMTLDLSCDLTTNDYGRTPLRFSAPQTCALTSGSSPPLTYLLQVLNQTNLDDNEILGLLKSSHPNWAAGLSSEIKLFEREDGLFFVSKNRKLPMPPRKTWHPSGKSWLNFETREFSNSLGSDGLFRLQGVKVGVVRQKPSDEDVFYDLLDENLKNLVAETSFRARLRAIEGAQGRSRGEKTVVVSVNVLSSSNLNQNWMLETALEKKLPAMLQTHLSALNLHLKFAANSETRRLRLNLERLENLYTYSPGAENPSEPPAHSKDVLALLLHWSESKTMGVWTCCSLSLMPVILPHNDPSVQIPLPALKANKNGIFAISQGGCH
jgi:hypothetical protein